jgi:hypothetical protein
MSLLGTGGGRYKEEAKVLTEVSKINTAKQ